MAYIVTALAVSAMRAEHVNRKQAPADYACNRLQVGRGSPQSDLNTIGLHVRGNEGRRLLLNITDARRMVELAPADRLQS